MDTVNQQAAQAAAAQSEGPQQADQTQAGQAQTGQAQTGQAQTGQAQTGQAAAAGAQAMGAPQGPMPGGLYQFMPGAGFVPVQGPQYVGPQAQPFYGMGMQPGMQQPQQPYAQPGMGMQQPMYMQPGPQQGMYGQGMPEGAQPKFDQNRVGPDPAAQAAQDQTAQQKMGQMYGMINNVMNGEDVDPGTLLSFFQGTGNEFWKGALVGAAAVLLLNNGAVKGALAGTFGSLFGDKATGHADLTEEDEA